MARLYDWEAFLTDDEKPYMAALARDLKAAQAEVKAIQGHRDEVRRKAVQRARNALNKQGREALREKG